MGVHNDLISRSALLDYFDAKAFNALELWDGGATRETWLEAFEVVRNAPAVDAEPVRHGRWETVQVWKDNPQTTLKCSVCNTCQPIYEHDDWTYCPF